MKRFIKIIREKIMFKVLNEVCQPTRATKYSAMVDLYAREDMVIGAGETKIVPLGVKISEDGLQKLLVNSGREFMDDYFKKSHYLELHPRSSLRVKGLIIGVGVIDLDFISHCKINKSLNNGYCEHFKPKVKE